MPCSGCSSNINGVPAGCKSNGSCGINGCDKLSVFDWLANMQSPENVPPFDHIEVRFKNGRKDFYKNVDGFSLTLGEAVAVEASPGHHIGIVSVTGELARMQMRKKKIKPNSESIGKVYRKASRNDIRKWEESKQKETDTMFWARKKAGELELNMKISDVEYQGDKTKATFYFTSEERVDFRELVKCLREEFKVRIDMRQLGMRQESGRIGGIGDCGRELCCSTWLTDFNSVTTSAARYQQLSLNPQKLAGQCGKLKCCLNYELDNYMEALKEFPDTGVKLETNKGKAAFMKMDIFGKRLWYTYVHESDSFLELSLNEVNRIMQLNKQGKRPEVRIIEREHSDSLMDKHEN